MEKLSCEESRRSRQEVRRSEKRKREKEDAVARKGRKVAVHCVFPKICGSGGSKSRLAKAAGAEPSGQMRDEKLHADVVRSTFWSKKGKNTSRSDHMLKLTCRKSARRCGAKHISKVKMLKAPHARTTFWRSDVEKVRADVARSTFPNQNVQNTSAPEHFWKLRCRKSAWGCGAKHIFKVKMLKAPHARTTFWRSDVEKVRADVARSTFPSQKCQKL